MLRKLAVFLTFAVALVLGVAYARFGGRGAAFPRQDVAAEWPDERLEVVASLPGPPGNIAVSGTGRIFFTYHAEARPEIKVLELVDGKPVPYPSLAAQSGFDAIFNLRIDRRGRLWTLDHGFHGLRPARLLAFDLETGAQVHEFTFPRAVAGFGSFLQDMQIDAAGRFVYVADTGVVADEPALVVYDSAARTARRLLVGHAALGAEDYEIVAKGTPMRFLGGFFRMHPGFDPIALDRAGEWLYVGPMSGATLSRVRTRDVLDASLSPGELAKRVEGYAPKVQCDGLTTDDAGNVYVTGIERGAIHRLAPDRTMTLLVQHPDLRWPDGMSFGPDGYVYVADSALQDVMFRSHGEIRAAGPYRIWRFASGQTAAPGQ